MRQLAAIMIKAMKEYFAPIFGLLGVGSASSRHHPGLPRTRHQPMPVPHAQQICDFCESYIIILSLILVQTLLYQIQAGTSS